MLRSASVPLKQLFESVPMLAVGTHSLQTFFTLRLAIMEVFYRTMFIRWSKLCLLSIMQHK